MRKRSTGNPFRIHGVVEGEYFTDRSEELKRLKGALTESGAKLLVYSPRRMGKTSTIMNAVNSVNQAGGHAFLVDLSTASTAVDMGNRILAEASRIMGRKWRNFIGDVVSRLNVTVTLTPDATGVPLPSIDVNLRGERPEKQRKTFTDVLDAIDETAGERNIVVGIALDEFQEIHKFGGETAQWELRAALQHHGNIGYILSGSRQHLIQRMIESSGALFKLVDKMPLRPISRHHMSQWIDRRMSGAGIEHSGIGSSIVQLAGSRTRDIVQVARRCYDLAVQAGCASVEDTVHAFEDIILEEHDFLYGCWTSLTAHQQNVLRALASAKKGLTTREVLEKFTLGASGTVINTVNNLIRTGYVIRQDPYTGGKLGTHTGYDFDSPFFKAWVIQHTLPDIGLA